MKAHESVTALLTLLERETLPQVRQYAIKALGEIGDEEARSQLESILNHSQEVEYNRVAAKAALSKLQHDRRETGQL